MFNNGNNQLEFEGGVRETITIEYLDLLLLFSPFIANQPNMKSLQGINLLLFLL